MTTIYDVAHKADVSTGTVSRYLNGNGYVGEAARERIKVAIQELNFRPSSVARGLTNKRTYMIGFVVPNLLNPFIPEVVRGAQDVADALDYCTLIYNTDEVGQREVRALRLLYDRRVDGLIIMPPETPEGNECIFDLSQKGLPIVLIGRQLEAAQIDRVSTSTYAGAIEAVQHLAELGHRRIALLGGEVARNIAAGRRRGYFEGMRRAGIPVDERLIIETPLTQDGGAASMARLLQLAEAPTAVFAVNDMVAIGAMQEFMRQGGRIPDGLSVVGFDDIALAAYTQPALTTIAQPKQLLGQTAVELLLARINNPDEPRTKEIRLPCKLILRGSTTRIHLNVE